MGGVILGRLQYPEALECYFCYIWAEMKRNSTFLASCLWGKSDRDILYHSRCNNKRVYRRVCRSPPQTNCKATRTVSLALQLSNLRITVMILFVLFSIFAGQRPDCVESIHRVAPSAYFSLMTLGGIWIKRVHPINLTRVYSEQRSSLPRLPM